jgi:hypothetical protein
MRYVFALLALLAANQASAQLFSKINYTQFLDGNGQWSEGRILLNDGTESRGHVKYNDRTGVVSFQSAEKSGSYHARNLAGFEIFGKDRRQFYSIPLYSSSGNAKYFFEVIREYKDFAVISRTSMLSHHTASELTTLYFFRASDMQITPYLEVLEREVKWRIFDANKIQVRVLNATLPKEIMGENFTKVKAFAKERRLPWHVVDSLISILDYYDSLVSN